MAWKIKDKKKFRRQDKFGGSEKRLAKERAEKLRKQKLKEEAKIGRRIDPVTLEEVETLSTHKQVRNLQGQLVLKPDEVNPNLNKDTPDQYVTANITTPDFDTSEFETILDNTVVELLPKRPEAKRERTIPERINDFFMEYEFLRDYIWKLDIELGGDGKENLAKTRSHVYLEKESDSYLPKPDTEKEYTGEQVGIAGRVKLQSGNKIICRDAVFLDTMVGARVTAYGIEPRKDSVLDVEHILKVIQKRMFQLNNRDQQQLNDIDVLRFMKHLKRNILSKYETEQVRRSELGDLNKLIIESIEKFYPSVEEIKKKIEDREELQKKKSTAEKIKAKREGIDEINLEMKKTRANRMRQYINARMRSKNPHNTGDAKKKGWKGYDTRGTSRDRNA